MCMKGPSSLSKKLCWSMPKICMPPVGLSSSTNEAGAKGMIGEGEVGKRIPMASSKKPIKAFESDEDGYPVLPMPQNLYMKLQAQKEFIRAYMTWTFSKLIILDP
jgi:hypothetical protein